MKRRWKILLLGACGVITIIAVCFFCLRENEPSYNGRTLSDWLEDYGPYQHAYGFSSAVRDDEAANAVAALGTNAVPWLNRWNHATYPWWLPYGFKLWDSGFHPRWLGHLLWIAQPPTKHDFAASGFEILGTNAMPALPVLERQFYGAQNESDTQASANLIGCFRQQGFDFFVRALPNCRTADQRGYAAIGIERTSHFVTNKADAIPPLIALLKSDEPQASQAAFALGQIRACPNVTIAALTTALSSTKNQATRVQAIGALQNFGASAKAAVPELQKLLSDTDQFVRFCARGTLMNLAPASLSNSTAISNGY